MKVIVTISISILIFFQSVGLGASDILMLKNLVEHAQYHSETYGDDFRTFIKKHYGSLKKKHQKEHKGEKSEKEKLPFQHNCFHHLMNEVTLMAYEFPFKEPVISPTANINFHYENLYSSFEKHSIFQPPEYA